MKKSRAKALDDLDRRLLALLQQDTAVTAEHLGSQVGLSASSVQRRIKRLRASGAIRREVAIVKAALPEADTTLVEEAVQFVQRLRREDLAKTPGIAETLDWVRALHRMHPQALPEDMTVLLLTLGCLLKTREDRFLIDAERLRRLVEGRRAGVAEKG